jgi:hypothetical protein
MVPDSWTRNWHAAPEDTKMASTDMALSREAGRRSLESSIDAIVETAAAEDDVRRESSTLCCSIRGLSLFSVVSSSVTGRRGKPGHRRRGGGEGKRWRSWGWGVGREGDQ